MFLLIFFCGRTLLGISWKKLRLPIFLCFMFVVVLLLLILNYSCIYMLCKSKLFPLNEFIVLFILNKIYFDLGKFHNQTRFVL